LRTRTSRNWPRRIWGISYEEMEFDNSTASFSTITDYAEAVDNNFHNEVDSVLCISTAEN
jgi:hypothetical protein